MEKRNHIDSAEQKELMLGILDYIVEYCRQNGLVYYLIGGSLIGAVRHGGFIPWDDDIDIAMMRTDYEKLVQSFNSNADSRYELLEIRTKPDFYLPYAKIIDRRTVLVESVHGVCPIGVNIDIFPLDYISEEAKNYYADTYLKKSLLERIVSHKSMLIRRDRPLWKNAITLFLRLICPIPYGYYTKKRIQRAEKLISKEPTEWIANLHGAWGAREITRADNFQYPVEGLFEGRKVNLPNGYDSWLTNVYGDYMTLPPEEKRVPHHDYIVYWR